MVQHRSCTYAGACMYIHTHSHVRVQVQTLACHTSVAFQKWEEYPCGRRYQRCKALGLHLLLRKEALFSSVSSCTQPLPIWQHVNHTVVGLQASGFPCSHDRDTNNITASRSFDRAKGHWGLVVSLLKGSENPSMKHSLVISSVLPDESSIWAGCVWDGMEGGQASSESAFLKPSPQP